MANPPIPTSDPATTAKSKSGDKPEAPKVEQPGKATSLDENMGFEVEALSHTAAAHIVAEIAERVKEAVTSSCYVVFLDDVLSVALADRRTFLQQVQVLKDAFASAEKLAKEVLSRLSGPQVKMLGPAAVSTAVAAAANLIGFFRHETTFQGHKTEIRDTALVAELARHFQTDNIQFRWPALGIFPGTLEGKPGTPQFVTKLNELSQAHDAAALLIHELATKVKNLPPAHPDLETARQDLDRANQQFAGAASVLDGLRKSLAAPDPETGLTLMNRLQYAADLVALLPGNAPKPAMPGPGLAAMDGPPAGSGDPATDSPPDDSAPAPGRIYFLSVKVEAAGGSYRIYRSLWSHIWSKDDGVSFSGGAVIAFMLTDSGGVILKSGTLPLRLGFRKFTQEETKFDHPAWT